MSERASLGSKANEARANKIDKMAVVGKYTTLTNQRVICFICDLKHYCDRHGLNFTNLEEEAHEQYMEERRL